MSAKEAPPLGNLTKTAEGHRRMRERAQAHKLRLRAHGQEAHEAARIQQLVRAARHNHTDDDTGF